jgi:hypothetical protein
MPFHIRAANSGAENLSLVQGFVVLSDDDKDFGLYVKARVPFVFARSQFPGKEDGVDTASLNHALALHALPLIEAGLRDGSYEEFAGTRSKEFVIDVSGDELAGARWAERSKQCRYQLSDRGDLFCGAGWNGGVGRRRLETSVAICSACDLPDARLLCSNLRHLRVSERESVEGKTLLALAAECDIGRAEARQQPRRCAVLGGLACSERRVDPVPRAPVASISPLSIHESIDYFGAVWVNAFKTPLLRLSVVAPGGVLATPCTGHQDFQAKLSALGEVFNSFHIQHEDPAVSGSLALMRAKLRAWGAEKGATPEDIASMERAVGVLQQTLALRAGQQHGTARERFERAVRSLGLSLPPPSYSDAWNRLQVALHDGLGELRRFIREHV